MIERQNILDIIGKNRYKYSSCIITSYSFDFTFFEERVMSILRLTGIKNVNVFLDGKHLDKQLETPTGKEFKTHKTYSLNPIYENGVFHPKIMLLTGPVHGLLIIGSGNLTSSGISTNDEIWGAFHFNSLESQNAPLFAATWNYLQQYFRQAKDFNFHKLEWISQRSAWINELKVLPVNQFVKINNGVELRFIANHTDTSFYQELTNLLPEKPIKALTIISPYFDEEGIILEQLHKDFKIIKTTCITDCEFGLLPIKMNNKLTKQIPFYNWKDCLKDFDKRYNRLHAKVFHFEFNDGWEYLLIGSANATINAFGSATVKPKNGEAGIILRRKMKKGYIHDLGINTEHAVPVDLKSFVRKSNNLGDSITSPRYIVHILYGELNGSKLTVHFKKKLEDTYTLNLFDLNNIETEKHEIKGLLNELKIHLQKANVAYKISISKNGKRISNFALLHNVEFQSKCNPDPKYAELNQIIESLSADPDNDQYIELLQHADYNWIDDDLYTGDGKSGSSNPRKPIEKYDVRIHGKMTEEEFNCLSSIQSREIEILNNPVVQIADIFNIIARKLIIPNKTIQENTEEGLAKVSEEEQTGVGEEVKQSISLAIRGQQEKRAIYKHLDKVYNFYSGQLKSFFENRALSDAPTRNLTIRDLSNISIAMDVLYIFYGKKYTINRVEFILKYSDINFANGIIAFVQGKSIAQLKAYIEEHDLNIPDPEGKLFAGSKSKIIEYIRNHKKDILLDYLRIIEKRHHLIRLDKTDSQHINWVYYEVDSSLFSVFKKEISIIDPILLHHQSEYTINIHDVDYVLEGVCNADDSYGLKAYLIQMLGSFLICANSSASFFRYPYDTINDKMQSLRNIIFERSTFLCLSINWGESELLHRDLLLLDLLHFICQKKISIGDILIVEKELISIHDKANKRSKSFNSNLEYFCKALLPQYIKWNEAYCLDKSRLVNPISAIPLSSIVFNRHVGFASLRSIGKDFLQLEKPGFPMDDTYDKFVLKINYPQQNIVVFDNWQNVKK